MPGVPAAGPVAGKVRAAGGARDPEHPFRAHGHGPGPWPDQPSVPQRAHGARGRGLPAIAASQWRSGGQRQRAVCATARADSCALTSEGQTTSTATSDTHAVEHLLQRSQHSPGEDGASTAQPKASSPRPTSTSSQPLAVFRTAPSRDKFLPVCETRFRCPAEAGTSTRKGECFDEAAASRNWVIHGPARVGQILHMARFLTRPDSEVFARNYLSIKRFAS